MKPDAQGEIQLTDALEGLARTNRLLAVKLSGERFDAGDWIEYLTANIAFALREPELSGELSRRLKELLQES